MTPRTLTDWLDLLERRHPKTIDLGLDRCGRVFQSLGAPRPGGRVITVGGTNGKGSAVAWLGSLLNAMGHSTATYTSPHLLRFNERLVIDGQSVADGALVDAFGKVEAARGAESLTYYEFTTLACLLLMEDARAEYALLEVGLGGRLDTVNLVDADLVVIMPIGLDHQAYLGEDRESIGHEKAGIMRPGRPVVCGEAEPPASVIRHAQALNCPLFRPGRDYHFKASAAGLNFAMDEIRWSLPAPPLPGPHQYANLAAALAAVAVLCGEEPGRERALGHGVSDVRLTGRLQLFGGRPRVLLDVGHNPMAAEAVAAHLAGLGGAACHCVLGMLADKDAEGVAAALNDRVAHWHCAGLPGARGQGGQDLARRVASVPVDAPVSTHESVGQALRAAQRAAGDDGLVLVFGSFETAAAATRVLEGGECC